MSEYTRVKPLTVVIVALVLSVTIIGLTTLFFLVLHQGNTLRSRITQCHDLGPGFHYWQDRDQCVQYVKLP